MPPVPAVLSPENIAQIQEIGRWGKGRIIDALYSPDRTQLTVATALGVYVYDTETAVQLSFIPVENIQLASMAVSPNWQWVAMGIEPDQIELRQLSDGSLRDTFTAPGGVRSLIFTVDGQHLLAPYAAWRVSDGVSIPSTYGLNPLATNGATIDMSTISANGKTVALRKEQSFEIVELTIGSEVNISKTGVVIPEDFHNRPSGAISPDGQLLAIGADSRVEVYQVSDGILLYTINNPVSPFMTDLEFTPDGQTLVVIGHKELSLWRVSDGRFLSHIPDANGDITFSADGTRMATWSDTLTQWDMLNGTRLNQLKQHAGWVMDLAFTTTSSHLAVASNFLYLRSVMDGGLLTSFPERTRGVVFTPDDQTLLSTSDRDLIFRNLVQSTSFTVIASESAWSEEDVALSADGKIAATVANDLARIWRVSDGHQLREGYSMNGEAVAFSPTESLFALFNNEGDVELWPIPLLSNSQTSVHEPIHSLDIQDARLSSLDFSPDGTLLAAGLDDGRTFVWRVSDGTLVQILKNHAYYNTEIAFSPDGQLLASISDNDTLKFWCVADGVLLNTILFPPKRLSAVEFSPNGRFLATGSSDGLVRLWGVP